MIKITKSYIQIDNWREKIRDFYPAYYWIGYDPIVIHLETSKQIPVGYAIQGLEPYNKMYGVYSTCIRIYPDCNIYLDVVRLYKESLEKAMRAKLRLAQKRYEKNMNWQVKVSFYFDLLEKYNALNGRATQWGEVKRILSMFNSTYEYRLDGLGNVDKFNDDIYVTIGAVVGHWNPLTIVILKKVDKDYCSVKRKSYKDFYSDIFYRRIPVYQGERK